MTDGLGVQAAPQIVAVAPQRRHRRHHHPRWCQLRRPVMSAVRLTSQSRAKDGMLRQRELLRQGLLACMLLRHGPPVCAHASLLSSLM
jgi:hypothetical protein